MSEWWWIVLAALAIIVALEFVIMRRSDTGASGGSVIDAISDDPSERETDRLSGKSDVDRARDTARLARQRTRQAPDRPPWGD